MREAVKSEAELHDAFRVFDRDGTGFLKRDEFRWGNPVNFPYFLC